MNTKTNLLATALVLGLAAMPAHAATLNQSDDADSQTHFTDVIDDLPLMEGLQTVDDKDVLFDEPSVGRIAETTAEGDVKPEDVYKFYGRSLPQLGWHTIDQRTFRRDNEILRIDARANGGSTMVKFSEKPAADR